MNQTLIPSIQTYLSTLMNILLVKESGIQQKEGSLTIMSLQCNLGSPQTSVIITQAARMTQY